LPGLNLFLSRGIEGLKQQAGCPVFLSFAHKSPEFAVEMQRGFVQMGLAVSEISPAFNEYEGAAIIGNTSQMIVLHTTSHTTPSICETFDDLLYTGELKRTIRVYQCKQCQTRFHVGVKGDYKTIEILKHCGCPQCGQTTFDFLERTTV
jgi:predicted methyltransferase